MDRRGSHHRRALAGVLLPTLLLVLSHDLGGSQTSADLNHDGRVDYLDLFEFQRRWQHRPELPSPTPTPTPHPGASMRIDLPGLPPGATPLEMVWIPAGTFLMGSNDTWAHGFEQPVHAVTLNQGFYLGKYEITQAQWAAVLGDLPIYTYLGDNYPIFNVTWQECQAFAAALNGPVDEPSYRLPTEAEWEYACRAGTTTRFSFGDSDCESSGCGPCELSNYAWWCANYAPASPSPHGHRPVGRLAPNPLGLHDMHGNVMEWCADWYGPYSSSPAIDPAGPVQGAYRVLRGGFWYYSAQNCRSALRAFDQPDRGFVYAGMRLLKQDPYRTTPTPTLTPTPTPTPTRTPIPGVFTVNLPALPEGATPLLLHLLPAGSFEMGSRDAWAYAAESPTRIVTLSRPFYMGRYEVTRAQWRAVLNVDPPQGLGDGDDLPVHGAAWTACQTFIAALNETGQGLFRLPTEAEWEYACRGLSVSRFAFGDSDCPMAECEPCSLDQYTTWCGNNTHGAPRPVGQFLHNAFGLYDMHGNVAEWCVDWYAAYAPGSLTDPTGPVQGTERVIRGGSWTQTARQCRSSYRSRGLPGTSYSPVGFRLVREAEPGP